MYMLAFVTEVYKCTLTLRLHFTQLDIVLGSMCLGDYSIAVM